MTFIERREPAKSNNLSHSFTNSAAPLLQPTVIHRMRHIEIPHFVTDCAWKRFWLCYLWIDEGILQRDMLFLNVQCVRARDGEGFFPIQFSLTWSKLHVINIKISALCQALRSIYIFIEFCCSQLFSMILNCSYVHDVGFLPTPNWKRACINQPLSHSFIIICDFCIEGWREADVISLRSSN